MENRLSVRGTVFSALFAAVLVACSFVTLNLGFTPVPISLENFAVMLTGALLGPLYGFFSTFLVVVLTALGLPLLHGEGGLALILGKTGGYIWMYPIASWLIGWTVSRVKLRGAGAFVLIFIFAELFGSLLLYVTGVPWLQHMLHLSFQKALVYGFYPYLLGDALKALVVAAIAVPIRQVYSVERITGTKVRL